MTKKDIQESSGFFQGCILYKAGSAAAAAVHTMCSLFQHEETDAVLLVNASNAFPLSSFSYICSQHLQSTSMTTCNRG